MQNRGEAPAGIYSFNTCLHRGRVFSFAKKGREVAVTELVLGERVRYLTVSVPERCGQRLGCCSLGEAILLLSEEGRKTTAFLVRVRDGDLTVANISFSPLVVQGGLERQEQPFLCRLSRNSAFLHFGNRGFAWRCHIVRNTLTIQNFGVDLSLAQRLDAVPAYVEGDKLLVAGSNPASTDITLISSGWKIDFRTVGTIPGPPRSQASITLLGGRFLLGFGGRKGDAEFTDLWIFDQDTQRASIILEKGDWSPYREYACILESGGVIYIFGGRVENAVHAITLRALSELIYDDAIRNDLCMMFGLPAVPLRIPVIPAPCTSLGMKIAGGEFRTVASYNTVQCGDRVFHFTQENGKLAVSEILFGQVLRGLSVNTYVDCKTDDSECIGCCRFNDEVLVMAGSSSRPSKGTDPEVFATLVSVEQGNLSRETLHINELTVAGAPVPWSQHPYLVQVSEHSSWLSFYDGDEVWVCDVQDGTMTLHQAQFRLPSPNGFGAPLVRLQDRTLLAAGGHPPKSDIFRISIGEPPRFERVGTMPGMARWRVSLIAVGAQILVGFGGESNGPAGDFWVFDLGTRVAAPATVSVSRAADWHPGASGAFLALWNGTLYIIGGYPHAPARSVSLFSLAAMVTLPAIGTKLLMIMLSLNHSSTLALQRELVEARSALCVAQAGHECPLPREPTISRRAGDQNDIVPVRLQLIELPSVRHLQKQEWRIDSFKLNRFRIAIQDHEASIPQHRGFLRDYRMAFRPLFEEKLPKHIFSVDAVACTRIAREQAVSQVANSLVPGQLFPLDCGLLSLARAYPLRPEEKLTDSQAMKKGVMRHSMRLQTDVGRQSPPCYERLVLLLGKTDPLQAEAIHNSIVKLRRVIQTARIPRRLGERLGEGEGNRLGEAVEVFRRMKTAADLGYGGREEVGDDSLDETGEPEEPRDSENPETSENLENLEVPMETEDSAVSGSSDNPENNQDILTDRETPPPHDLRESETSSSESGQEEEEESD